MDRKCANGVFQHRGIYTEGAFTEENKQCGRLKIYPSNRSGGNRLLPSLRRTYVQSVFEGFDGRADTGPFKQDTPKKQ